MPIQFALQPLVIVEFSLIISALNLKLGYYMYYRLKHELIRISEVENVGYKVSKVLSLIGCQKSVIISLFLWKGKGEVQCSELGCCNTRSKVDMTTADGDECKTETKDSQAGNDIFHQPIKYFICNHRF